MVAERVVLRRVEHLEQGGGGVAAEVRTELVDLVEEDDRVHRARLAQGAHQATRLGAHVGPAMAADLGLVAHTAERHPDERTTEGPGDGLTQ